jgi:hypothetical protein
MANQNKAAPTARNRNSGAASLFIEFLANPDVCGLRKKENALNGGLRTLLTAGAKSAVQCIFFSGKRELRNQPKLRRFAHPRRDSRVLFVSPFEMIEILLQGRFVELRQKLRRHRGVVPADIIDKLTFVHCSLTFFPAV